MLQVVNSLEEHIFIVAMIFQELLQSSALDSWRIATQGDFEVSTYLGNLRMDPMESAESSPEHHYRSSDEEEELQTDAAMQLFLAMFCPFFLDSEWASRRKHSKMR